jgi:hypothetical protein
MPIWEDRDGAQGMLNGNLTNAGEEFFIDAEHGDLHLNPGALAAIDKAAGLSEVFDDFDAQSRPFGSAGDLGADELYFIPGDQRFFLPLVESTP